MSILPDSHLGVGDKDSSVLPESVLPSLTEKELLKLIYLQLVRLNYLIEPLAKKADSIKIPKLFL